MVLKQERKSKGKREKRNDTFMDLEIQNGTKTNQDEEI